MIKITNENLDELDELDDLDEWDRSFIDDLCDYYCVSPSGINEILDLDRAIKIILNNGESFKAIRQDKVEDEILDQAYLDRRYWSNYFLSERINRIVFKENFPDIAEDIDFDEVPDWFQIIIPHLGKDALIPFLKEYKYFSNQNFQDSGYFPMIKDKDGYIWYTSADL